MLLKDKKQSIRTAALRVLKSMPVETRGPASRIIHDIVVALPKFDRAKYIGIFISMPHEVETRGIIKTSLELGKRVFVPRTQGKVMTLLEIYSVDEIDGFVKTKWGIPEPSGNDNRAALEQKQPLQEQSEENDDVLVIVPGVAFNANGRRIGYGGGYYDRYLNALNRAREETNLAAVGTVGIAFHCQVMEEEIPIDQHDVVMHQVVTDG